MADTSQPIKVLLVAGADFFSGAERALLLTAQSLADAGHLPFLVIGTDGEMLAQARQRGLPAVHVPLCFTEWRRLPRWLASFTAIRRAARAHGAQLVHTNEAPSFQLPGYVARHLKLPALTHVRFPEVDAGYRWYLKAGFARALFVSEYLKHECETVAPTVFGGRGEVVYDGVVMPELPSDTDRAAGRAALDLPGDRPAIVIAGQVIEIKGIFDYIEAARLLCARGVRATFVVMGDDLKNQGATRREAESRVAALGLQSHFRFLGFRKDAPALIPLFDIVAVPSHIEPLGNATLEAMAAGLPVVGARVGGIPEMIVEGQTGLLVPSKTPGELAAALENLVRDPQRARGYGAAGRQRALTAFSLSAHAERLTGIYRHVLSEKGRH